MATALIRGLRCHILNQCSPIPYPYDVSGCHTEYIRGKGNDVCHYLEKAGTMMVQVGLKPQRLLDIEAK